MPKSYRLKTTTGVDKSIRVKIEQDFDFLEVLSLKLRQEDVYTRFCADYGVVAGRVIANGGYGVPNVMVSVFIPLDDIDEGDPIISTLYPYKQPGEKNEDGYRYNLLPYVDEYSGHTATGTFPTRGDLLTRKEVLQVYEKYYKYTVRTNDSGDFMVVGVPLGQHKVVMDIDLSNIGEFSLRPSDLIRQGLGTASQFSGEMFRSSENLDALPQILHDVVDVDVASFWGEDDICDVGITRIDFDLRELGIEIEPTCVFMGSMFSSSEDDFLRANCKPKSNTGNLCDTVAGPGQILAIRQTIDEDSDGEPILEEYILENGGNIIDENGVWLIDVPMNMNYVVTNEYGEKVTSNDPSVGIPTSGKYRFKIKWQNEAGLQGDILRANYLVPNIREHWDNGSTQPTTTGALDGSYAFSLDWDEYADKESAINCDDTFYKFGYNKVYAVASHIDRYKFGHNRARHLGIKEITDKSCQSENNRLPVNDAQRNFDILFFLFSLLMGVLTIPLLSLLVVIHLIAFLYNVMTVIINGMITLLNLIIRAVCKIAKFVSFGLLKLNCNTNVIPKLKTSDFYKLSLPMLSYPDCEACSCKGETGNAPESDTLTEFQEYLNKFNISVLSDLTIREMYDTNAACYSQPSRNDALRMVISGYDYTKEEYQTAYRQWYLSPIFPCYDGSGDRTFRISEHVTLAQSMNLINQRSKYFNNNNSGEQNVIKTTVVNNQLGAQSTPGYFTDLPLITMMDKDTVLVPGQLLTTVNPDNINDPNVNLVPSNDKIGTYGLSSTLITNTNDYIDVDVTFVTPSKSLATNTVKLYSPPTETTYKFKSGVEYYQVITGITIGDLYTEFLKGGVYQQTYKDQSILYNYIIGLVTRYGCNCDGTNGDPGYDSGLVSEYVSLKEATDQVVYFMTKGVDPYTPKQMIEYDLSILFGRGLFNGEYKVSGEYYMNIPIQQNKITQNNIYNTDTPEPHYLMSGEDYVSNTNNIADSNLFHSSYLFTPDPINYQTFTTTGFTTYSSMDGTFNKSGFINVSAGLSSYNYPVTNVGSRFGHKNYKVANDNIKVYNDSNDIFLQDRIDGCSYQYSKLAHTKKLSAFNEAYTISSTYTKTFLDPGSTNIPETTISDSTKLVFRSDRLPSSDGQEFGLYPALNNVQNYVLHLNNNFMFYTIDDDGNSKLLLGEEQTYPDDDTGNLLDFNEDTNNSQFNLMTNSYSCGGIIPLNCYETAADGTVYVAEDCIDEDRISGEGCYTFVDTPLIDVIDDINYFFEWQTRIRFMFGICRGVIGTMFQNNWINGTLYMPAFQKKNTFGNNNEVISYDYCGEDPTSKIGPLYFNETTDSFFYRSTPYYNSEFIGQTKAATYKGMNSKNIWFPTTIMDLGPKTEFLKEVILTPDFESYIMDTIKSTSYNDLSDIIILFVISRLSSSSFIQQVLRKDNGSIQGLFSRETTTGGVLTNFFDARIDGDVAQLFSINSEYGVIPYVEGNYTENQVIVTNGNVGVWFDSNRDNRRVLTPGITNFGNNITNKFGHPNSQEIPYYGWKINGGDSNPEGLFGTQHNSWDTTNIKTTTYQGDDFDASGNYVVPSNGTIDGLGYGYIYNAEPLGTDPETYAPLNAFPDQENNVKVGGPFHFYFGLKRGKSAINRFITKYILLRD